MRKVFFTAIVLTLFTSCGSDEQKTSAPDLNNEVNHVTQIENLCESEYSRRFNLIDQTCDLSVAYDDQAIWDHEYKSCVRLTAGFVKRYVERGNCNVKITEGAQTYVREIGVNILKGNVAQRYLTTSFFKEDVNYDRTDHTVIGCSNNLSEIIAKNLHAPEEITVEDKLELEILPDNIFCAVWDRDLPHGLSLNVDTVFVDKFLLKRVFNIETRHVWSTGTENK
jgi:hypothetical protein